MPIYEYRCSACGYQNDYLQKLSEPQLTECPKCGKSTFTKQVTAAGFQLKGTGWYATDFRDKGKAKSKPAAAKEETKSADSAPAAETGSSKPDAASGSAAATPAGS